MARLRSTLTKIIVNILCWAAFTLLIPLVIAVMLPLRLYKTVIILLAKSRKHLSTTLKGYDSIFAIDDYYRNPFAANATFIILESRISLQNLVTLFKRRVLDLKVQGGSYKYIRLRSMPVNFGGFFFWRYIQPDLEKHIRVVHCDDLSKELGVRMTSPFPSKSALWELLLLEWGGKSVLLFRLHHVLGDGYSANHIIDLLIGEESAYRVGPMERWSGGALLFLTTPSRLATLYLSAFVSRGRDRYTTPKRATRGLVSYTDLDLQRLRSLRRSANVHFATLGMCLLVGALQRHFRDPSPPHVSVMHSLPRPGHPLHDMVNHWAVGLFLIPYSSSDRLKRLQMAEEYFNEYNKAGFKEIIHYHMPLFNLLPSPLVKLFFKTNFGTGIGFTSLPGAERVGNVCGVGVEGMWKLFGFQWSQTALASAMYSNGGRVGVTLYANEDLIGVQEELDRVTQVYLLEELEGLEADFGIKS